MGSRASIAMQDMKTEWVPNEAVVMATATLKDLGRSMVLATKGDGTISSEAKDLHEVSKESSVIEASDMVEHGSFDRHACALLDSLQCSRTAYKHSPLCRPDLVDVEV